jgi:hypothetical protein
MDARNKKPLKEASNPMYSKAQSKFQQKFQPGDLYSLRSWYALVPHFGYRPWDQEPDLRQK